uniref:YkvS family protein n=1 Tax=Sporosarcina aquimarina TaxID=114975 RepID=UPI0037DA4C45
MEEIDDIEVAGVGSIIEFKEGLQGIVEKVNDNSVIVNLTYMENFEELGLEEKTVVNHKRYTILHKKEA